YVPKSTTGLPTVSIFTLSIPPDASSRVVYKTAALPAELYRQGESVHGGRPAHRRAVPQRPADRGRRVSRRASNAVKRGVQPRSCFALVVSMIAGWLAASTH